MIKAINIHQQNIIENTCILLAKVLVILVQVTVPLKVEPDEPVNGIKQEKNVGNKTASLSVLSCCKSSLNDNFTTFVYA